MTDEEIRDTFDQNWSITLRQLAKLSGRSLEDVKRVLLLK